MLAAGDLLAARGTEARLRELRGGALHLARELRDAALRGLASARLDLRLEQAVRTPRGLTPAENGVAKPFTAIHFRVRGQISATNT